MVEETSQNGNGVGVRDILHDQEDLAKIMQAIGREDAETNQNRLQQKSQETAVASVVSLTQTSVDAIGQAVSDAMVKSGEVGPSVMRDVAPAPANLDGLSTDLDSDEQTGRDNDTKPESTPQPSRTALPVIVQGFGDQAETELLKLFDFDKIKDVLGGKPSTTGSADKETASMDMGMLGDLLMGLGGGVGLAGAGLGAGVGMAGAGLGFGGKQILEGGGGLLKGAGDGIGAAFDGIGSGIGSIFGGGKSSPAPAPTAAATGGEILDFSPEAGRKLIGIVHQGIARAKMFGGKAAGEPQPAIENLAEQIESLKEAIEELNVPASIIPTPAPEPEPAAKETSSAVDESPVEVATMDKQPDVAAPKPVEVKQEAEAIVESIPEIKPDNTSMAEKGGEPIEVAEAPAKAEAGDGAGEEDSWWKRGLSSLATGAKKVGAGAKKVGAAGVGFASGMGRQMAGAYTGGLSEKFYFEKKDEETAKSMGFSSVKEWQEADSPEPDKPEKKEDGSIFGADKSIIGNLFKGKPERGEPVPTDTLIPQADKASADATETLIEKTPTSTLEQTSADQSPAPVPVDKPAAESIATLTSTPDAPGEPAQVSDNKDIIQELKSGKLKQLLESMARDIKDMATDLPTAIASIQSGTTVVAGGGGGGKSGNVGDSESSVLAQRRMNRPA